MTKSEKSAGKGNSKGGLVPALGISSLLATLGGFAVSTLLSTGPGEHPYSAAALAPPALTKVLDVPPVVTNLAAPESSFVRVQLALVVGKSANLDVNSFATDVATHLRALPLERLQGSIGLLHLREDLYDRADVRFAGQVQELIIHDLVVQ